MIGIGETKEPHSDVDDWFLRPPFLTFEPLRKRNKIYKPHTERLQWPVSSALLTGFFIYSWIGHRVREWCGVAPVRRIYQVESVDCRKLVNSDGDGEVDPPMTKRLPEAT